MGSCIRLLAFILIILHTPVVCFADDIGNDSIFVAKIESMMPPMPLRHKNELHQMRSKTSPLEYVGLCEYYAHTYHNISYNENSVELLRDSLLYAGIDYMLSNHVFRDKGAPYLFMRYATRLQENGYDDESAIFARIGVEVALSHQNGSYIYGELRCIEADCDIENNPAEALMTRLQMLKGFKSEFDSEPNEDTFERYIRNTLKTAEMALIINNVEMADSLLQESLDILYDRKNSDVISGKVSVVRESSPYMFHIASIESEIALKKHRYHEVLELQESLLWRYYECWVLNRLSASDYIRYFSAVDYLIENNQFNRDNYEHLIYASEIIRDWLCKLSYKVSSKLRVSYIRDARSIILKINGALINFLSEEDVNETILNNVILFKNLQLQLDKQLSLNLKDDRRLDYNLYIDDFRDNVVIAMLRTKCDYINRQWNLERNSLEKSGFPKWIKTDWHEIQQSLPPNGCMIEFFLVKRDDSADYYGAVITDNNKRPHIVKLCSEQEILSVPIDKMYGNKSFSNLIWSSLRPFIKSCSDIFYAPDGVIYNIAIEHLYDIFEENECMADKFNIFRLSSMKDLIPSKANDVHGLHRIAIFSNIDYNSSNDTSCNDSDHERGGWLNIPKLGSKFCSLGNNEVSLLSHLSKKYGHTSDLFTGASATKFAFKSLENGNYDMIHISSHGFYIPVDTVKTNPDFQNLSFIKYSPMSSSEELSMNCSGIALSGANNIFNNDNDDASDEGILTASDVSHIDLSSTDFVFLSTCQSGLGLIQNDGVFGMHRGFKIAGVKSMIYTLWNVNNDACEIFEKEFYANYFSGKSKFESFNAAKNKLRTFCGVYNEHSYDFSKPKYWAGFVLVDGF